MHIQIPAFLRRVHLHHMRALLLYVYTEALRWVFIWDVSDVHGWGRKPV